MYINYGQGISPLGNAGGISYLPEGMQGPVQGRFSEIRRYGDQYMPYTPGSVPVQPTPEGSPVPLAGRPGPSFDITRPEQPKANPDYSIYNDPRLPGARPLRRKLERILNLPRMEFPQAQALPYGPHTPGRYSYPPGMEGVVDVTYPADHPQYGQPMDSPVHPGRPIEMNEAEFEGLQRLRRGEESLPPSEYMKKYAAGYVSQVPAGFQNKIVS